MTISIHQPNFFPWAAYFQKIEQSDVFVILGHCQFEKNNYQNRFNLNNKWHTMSINKGIEPIINKKYIKPYIDWIKIKKRLFNYGLDQFDDCILSSLFETNVLIIRKILELTHIKTKVEYDYTTNLTRSERLVDICKHYGATKYLSGISGKNYLDLKLFEKNEIDVVFQDESKMIKKPILEIL